MTVLPTGTVTFLFTDIEGSTRMWERSSSAMSEALARHDEILGDAIEANGGYVFKTVGDAFCAAFPTAPEALEATHCAQRALSVQARPEEIGALRVRMAVHTGATEERGGDYFGPPVNRVARLLSAGHGGQVLLSLATQELVRDELPEGVGLRDLGERRLKDLFRPERVFQLIAPDLPSGFPPLKTLDARLNNLPTQPTPLVGREREVAEVCGRLRRVDVRLLTLIGPGGTGKTRLGLQAGAELLDEFEGGVFFVALAPVSDPDLVASTIAGPLGVVESGDKPLEETLKGYLQDKELLLLLDNFEQVLEAAPLVGELLGSCPRLKVLATSRAALRVYGEQEYAVPPLTLPDPKRLTTVEKLSQYEAVGLFIERARAVKADFEVTNDNAPAVAEICVRLDGLPLAIELAAARTRLLSPEAMLPRLGSRLKLLIGGGRDLPARQQTLRGAIEWSHDLLDEEERTLFRRLSVFVGGFALETAEEVCDAGSEPEVDVLDGVESLLGKSLLRQEETEDGRLFMLETIREYALERLEASGEAGGLRVRHADYYLLLAEEAEPELRGSQQAQWLRRLETEHDNLRAALSWTLGQEPDATEPALRLAGALWWFWFWRGHFSEGRRWLEEALEKDERLHAPARAKALAAVAWLALYQGDLERMVAASEEGLGLDVEKGIEGSTALFLRIIRGVAAREQGDTGQATILLEEALALGREAGDRWSLALALLNLGGVASNRGDYERAMEQLEECLALSRGLGDAGLLSAALISLGYEFLLQGDHERATALNAEAAALLRGDDEQARDLLKESLALSGELGDGLNAAESLDGLACTAAARGEAGRAARLFGAAEALREAMGIPLPSAARALREPYTRAARSRLDEVEWTRRWEEGRAMSQEEAVALALKDERD
jgi:predicted ATPase/class 3 adenylate cyclase